jgi:dTDP-4-dehydrorhamnose reductase
MTILLTGATGQLGRALLANAAPAEELVATDRAQLDLADAQAIADVLQRHRPRVVINAAAYTAVDKAENERDLAYAVNAHAVGVLGRCCRDQGCRLIHVSTDFVFDGVSGRPYLPQDRTNPLSVYGASKLEGERQIAAVENLNWLVVRTAWVYANEGRNFMLTMLRLFRERATVSVVCDQVGTPTSATGLAQCIWRAVDDRGESAVLHYTDAGVASWYDFAVAIYEEARALGLIDKDVRIVPIASSEYPTPARRPAYSVLDKRGTWARLGLQPVHWREALRGVLTEMMK